MFKTMTISAAIALAAGAAFASGGTVHEVKMLNKGETGVMVFEPAYIKAEPGDVIRFLPTDKGHNVESIDGMLPEDVEAFKTGFNETFELTVDKEGVYGVKCTPHYAMGMVAVIQAGDAVNLDEAAAVTHKAKAKDRMADLIAQVE